MRSRDNQSQLTFVGDDGRSGLGASKSSFGYRFSLFDSLSGDAFKVCDIVDVEQLATVLLFRLVQAWSFVLIFCLYIWQNTRDSSVIINVFGYQDNHFEMKAINH